MTSRMIDRCTRPVKIARMTIGYGIGFRRLSFMLGARRARKLMNEFGIPRKGKIISRKVPIDYLMK